MKHNSKFGKKYSLTILTCVTACLAFIMLCVSISTDNWLSTFERDSDDNGTTVLAIHSGLWRQCRQSQYIPGISKRTSWNVKMKTFPTNDIANCSYIKYFKGKQGGQAEIKPPEAILSDMQPAAFFPTTGLLGLLTGCILSFLSYCDQKVKKLIFVGGGLFVLSGIFMLVGIVLYVGSISQAFDSTAGNLDSEEKYVYDYGGSFYFSVVSFIFTEFSGIFAIYLYIAKHRHYLRIKREKIIARSQSVNSCVGLVPSVSRFSFETPQEQLVNTGDLSSKRQKADRDIASLTCLEWCDVNSSHTNHCSHSQWHDSNTDTKAIISTSLRLSQSHDKLCRVSANGHNKVGGISTCNDLNAAYTLPKPVTMFYEGDKGETSFAYAPKIDYNDDRRVFYDNTASKYYVDDQYGLERRNHMVISPDRSILSTIMSPRHNIIEDIYPSNRILTSPIEQLMNMHLLTSLDDPRVSSNDKHCNCAQIELQNHLPVISDSSLIVSSPRNAVLPHNSILSGSTSSRKITSV